MLAWGRQPNPGCWVSGGRSCGGLPTERTLEAQSRRTGRLAGDGGEGCSWRRDRRDKGWKQVGYSVGMCMIHMAQSFWEETWSLGDSPGGTEGLGVAFSLQRANSCMSHERVGLQTEAGLLYWNSWTSRTPKDGPRGPLAPSEIASRISHALFFPAGECVHRKNHHISERK